MGVTGITIASSRGKYTDEVQLSALVMNDFNRTASEHLVNGFGFTIAQIELHKLLSETFFLKPNVSVTFAQPKLDAATCLPDGG